MWVLLGSSADTRNSKTLDSLDTETTVFKRGRGFAPQMAAARDRRPHRRISGPLHGPAKRMLRHDMLIEAKLAAGPNDAVQLRDGLAGVPDRAQHQRGDGSVDAGILERKVLGDSVSHLHRNRRVTGGAGGQTAKIGVGFEGMHHRHRLRVASWRTTVDPTEPTPLVTGGVFRIVRNPIYTAMIIMVLGLTMLVPNAIALAGLVMMLVGAQLQVRLIEEPYLRRVHGHAYHDYTARVGRFLPDIGRLRCDRH